MCEEGGLTPDSKKDTIVDIWQLFFTDDLLTKILTQSKAKLQALNLQYDSELNLASLKALEFCTSRGPIITLISLWMIYRVQSIPHSIKAQ